MEPDDVAERAPTPHRAGGPGVDRRAAHADVALLGPEETYACRCPTCGGEHRAVRREVLYAQHFSQDLAAALAAVGAHALVYQPGGDSSPPTPAGQLAPRLAEARLRLLPEAELDEAARLLDRLLRDYQHACLAHPSATVAVTLTKLMLGRPTSRGHLGPFADGEVTWLARSSVAAVGKLRRRQYAAAHLLVRLDGGRELLVFPSRQWPEDRAWLAAQTTGLLARVEPGAPYAEQWRDVHSR